jgi:tellurite resistance protein
MVDFEQVKAKISTLISEVGRKLKQYTPEKFSKEKKFINALVGSLALMTMADKKAETEEVIASIDLIKEIDEITELDMTQDALELYEYHIEALSSALSTPTKWLIAEARMLSEIAKIKAYPEYPPMVEALIEHIANSDGNVDPLEIAMQDKIVKAIR